MSTIAELVDEYDRDHHHPANRALHMVGITLIGASIPVAPFAPWWALGAFTVGWAAQFGGHAIEGKPPSFQRDWRFTVAGAYWYARQVRRFTTRVAG